MPLNHFTLSVHYPPQQAARKDVDSKKVVQTITASRVEDVPVVIIPKTNALGKTVRNVEALIKDLPPEATVDGLLGLSFLKYFKLTIDFKKGLLNLE